MSGPVDVDFSSNDVVLTATLDTMWTGEDALSHNSVACTHTSIVVGGAGDGEVGGAKGERVGGAGCGKDEGVGENGGELQNGDILSSLCR
jgi:hypothetical protein